MRDSGEFDSGFGEEGGKGVDMYIEQCGGG